MKSFFGVVGLARMVAGLGMLALSMDSCGFEPSSFVTVWETTPDATVTIPTNDEFSYLYDVDCQSDGVWDFEAQTGPVTCEYEAEGVYTVAVRGEYPYFRGNSQLLDIRQWGDIEWQSMRFSFADSNRVEVTATDVPDLRNVTDMRGLFRGAAVADPDVSGWDVSNVTEMNEMFAFTAVADPDVSGWDVSNVTDLTGMFFGAAVANPDVSGWDVSNANFTGGMFWNAPLADPDVSGWDVSNVALMQGMFWNAVSADPDVSGWDVSRVRNMFQMFANSGLSLANYDALLDSWSGQALTTGVNFGAGVRTYCNAGPARQRLIDEYGWFISDGGLDPTC